MIRIRVQQDVLETLRRLPPKPRHAIRLAIKGLSEERGDIRPLVDELDGYFRRRVGSYRVIFQYDFIEGTRTITCVFLESRRWVYEVFQSRLQE